jgi:hypothetical protein
MIAAEDTLPRPWVPRAKGGFILPVKGVEGVTCATVRRLSDGWCFDLRDVTGVSLIGSSGFGSAREAAAACAVLLAGQ